jgi:tetratricopeptide (TPR) repeat protein
MRGVALARAEFWEEAIVCYDRALALDPTGGPGWVNKGVALCYVGRFADALECFEEGQRLGLPHAAEAISLCRNKLAEKAEQAAAAAHETATTADRAVDATSPPGEIRVFISSTFRDLQAEREHLIKHVFPQLRRLCSERGVGFTEIDLRWGITDEESRQGKVIKICLDEIGRCRPFFIGVLGARYGWTPPLEDVERNAELLEAYPWVRQSAADGTSVTEMEIVHGVLGSPWSAEHAYFYFLDVETTGPDAAKLAALKARIRRSGRPVREHVGDVATLGRLVYDDLVALVDREYPPSLGVTPLARGRRAHDAFAASRRRAYIAHPVLFEQLDAHVAGDDPALAVTGESGSGKSALLANWSARPRRDAFVLAHYVGADGTGGDAVGLMRRVMGEIRARYDSSDELPATAAEIEAQFPSWLARVRGEQLVLVLDGVDQLAGDGASLAWLPMRLPPQVRLIVSGVSGRLRRWPDLVVSPLAPDERRTLTTSFLAQYRKVLTDEQAQQVAQRPQSANPLFLRTVLEELRVFGSFEELDARIAYFASAPDLPDLFQRVLARLENDFGTSLVRELATLLWAARSGLDESEFLELTGRSRIELSMLLAALEYHLVRHDGLMTFAHEHLRDAAVARYLPGADQQKAAHARLAGLFQRQMPSVRRDFELPWQLEQAEAWEDLRDCLADMSDSSVLGLMDSQREYELLGYWNALGERVDMVEAWLAGLAAYEAQNREPNELYSRYNRLGLLLRLGGRYDQAAEILQRSLTLAESGDPPDQEQVWGALHNLALVRQAAGAYDEAAELERRALGIRELEGEEDDLQTTTSLNTLGMVLNALSEYAAAESLFRRALAIRKRVLGADHHATATVANNLASLLGRVGRLVEAEELFTYVADTFERKLGPEHPDTARAFTNLGALQRERGSPNAERLLRRGLEIREHALGPDHPDTAHSLEQLATLLYERGDFATAEALVQRTLAIHERALGPEHGTTAATLDRLAGIHDEYGDLDSAESLYRRALAAKERAAGPEHPSTALTLSNLGYLLVKRGELDAAEPLLQRALEIRERALGPDHLETAQSLNNLAGLRGRRGDHVGAELLLQRAAEIYVRTLGPEHPEAAAIHANLAAARAWHPANPSA